MENHGICLAERLLDGTGISLLDAARLIKNAIDFNSTSRENLKYCRDVIECGRSHLGAVEKYVTLFDAFWRYAEAKKHLRKDSFRDIKYLGKRILKKALCKKFVCEFTPGQCFKILNDAFQTPSQFNKGRRMLHGLFSYAVKMKWCAKNPVSEIAPKKILEREIAPLPLFEIQKLLKAALSPAHLDCAPALGIMLWAGVRPRETTRLAWGDVDLEEGTITVKARNSKTGGICHIDICPALKSWLKSLRKNPESSICPKNWGKKWKALRRDANLESPWVQDVLRHTFASYYMKRYKNLPRLQSQMGHADLSLLRTRYVNMYGIKKGEAKIFFDSPDLLRGNAKGAGV